MNQIKALREAANMTQAELAGRLGISPPSVAKWENGRANPSYENLVQLADIFGCSLDAVAGRVCASA